MVIASRENGYLDPDEDGFGAEIYCDWWFLDEYMQPIPGVEMINWSLATTRSNGIFSDRMEKAERILRQRLKIQK